MTASETRNVTLSIGGRSHVMSVAPGEEAHVRMLARMIDDRVRKLGFVHGQTEARMLLVAALVLADELHTLQQAPPPPPPEPADPAPDHQLLAHITALADRVEKLAARLEHSGEAP